MNCVRAHQLRRYIYLDGGELPLPQGEYYVAEKEKEQYTKVNERHDDTQPTKFNPEVLSAKERERISKKYEETRKRIGQARAILEKISENIRSDKKLNVKNQQALYLQAKALLERTELSLPREFDWRYRDDGIELLDRKSIEIFRSAVLAHGFDLGDSASTVYFNLNLHDTLMHIDLLRSYHYTDDEIRMIFKFGNKENSNTNSKYSYVSLEHFLDSTRVMGISLQESLIFSWDTQDKTRENHVLAELRILKLAGVEKDYWACIQALDDLQFTTSEQIHNFVALVDSTGLSIPTLHAYMPHTQRVNNEHFMAMLTGLKNAGFTKDDFRKMFALSDIFSLPNLPEIISFSRNSALISYSLVGLSSFLKEYGRDLIPKISTDNVLLVMYAYGEFAKTPDGDIDRAFFVHVLKRSQNVDAMNMRFFFSEPALAYCRSVYKVLEPKDPEIALMIGRNLYFEDFPHSQPITKEVVEERMREIQKMRESTDAIPLFEGRNVIVAMHRERLPDGSGRFNNPEIHDGMNKSVGSGTVTFHGAEQNPTRAELAKIKQDILTNIATAKPPMTFLFNGHGDFDKLCLVNHEVINGHRMAADDESKYYISVSEFAAAVATRNINFPKSADLLRQDIYIFASCFNQNFIRNMYAMNRMLDGVPPICIGESDLGQYGFTAPHKMQQLYHLGEQHVVLGDVRKAEAGYSYSNISIFVPTSKSSIRQITENKARNGKNTSDG